jgi:transposase
LHKLAIQMKEKSEGVKHRKYDASFREEVVKMVLSGRPVGEVAQSLGIGENLIYRRKSRYGPHQHAVTIVKAGSAAVASQDQQFLLNRHPGIRDGAGYFKKGVSHFQSSDLKQLYAFIRQVSHLFAIATQCRVGRGQPQRLL